MAVEHLVEVMYQPLLTILVAIDRDAATDACQEAFEKYIHMFRSGRPPPRDAEAYFVAIAKNTLIDELRRRKRLVRFDEILSIALENRPSEAPDVDLKLDVITALSRLDARCRLVLESYYIADKETSTIAEEIGVSPQSVYMTLKRCRENLRRIYENDVRK